MKIILEYFGDKVVVLPNRFEEFLKKMKVEQQITECEFIFVNDLKQKSLINNTSTYEKMKQQIPSQQNPRLMVAKNFHDIDKELIQKTNFVDIFYNDKEIPCLCEFQKKECQDCPYCNGSQKLPVGSFRNELNNYFIEYFEENFTILKNYINETYKIKIQSFSEWLAVHKQLVTFNTQEEFIFQCTQCRQHFSNQQSVYVKNFEFPFKPICVNCFTKLNYLYQKNYEKLVCTKNTEEDISSLAIPKLF